MNMKLMAASVVALLSISVQAQVIVSTQGGLKVSSDDYQFQLGGRIMYDYNRAELNGVVDEDQFDLRRGRIFVKGNIARDWKFKAQFNIDGSGAEDLYLRYTGWGKGAHLTIGNQKQPFGLDDANSSKDISVLERSASTELFAIERTEGVKLHGDFANNIHYGVGLFTTEVDGSSDEEFGYAARIAWAPVKTDNSVVHLGLAYQDTDARDAFGLEAAAVVGAFHVQAEYSDGTIDNTDVDGFYVQAGYVLTGETRPYKGGKFKRVKPAGKIGAWEVVARYEDGDGNFSDIELGTTSAQSYTIGLNWYAHKNVRFGINYTDGEDDLNGDDGDELRVRFQLTY